MSFDLKLINGDLSIKNGDLQTAIDSEKLIQDILKICLTSAGSLQLHPWYGSFLSRAIIGNPDPTATLAQIAKSQLHSALENLKTLQDLQVKNFQRVSADEQIASVSDISVFRSQIDPRLFNVTVTVISKGLKPITTRFSVNTI